MIEIVITLLKIIGIIVAWELLKYIGWRIVCWWVEKQVEKYEKQHYGDISKCPYLNSKNNNK